MLPHLKEVTNVLARSSLSEDSCFDDVCEVLKAHHSVRHVRYSTDKRAAGTTHFLRVGFGGAILCIDVFTNDIFFSVRRGMLIHDGTTHPFRWHHTLEGFEYEGPAKDREALYRFLEEVIKGF